MDKLVGYQSVNYLKVGLAGYKPMNLDKSAQQYCFDFDQTADLLDHLNAVVVGFHNPDAQPYLAIQRSLAASLVSETVTLPDSCLAVQNLASGKK